MTSPSDTAGRDTPGLRIVYVNLNVDPHLPPDGGRTSIPHLHVAFEGSVEVPVGVMVVSTGRIIDMVYVDPAYRGKGVSDSLYRHAVETHGRIGTDERLTPAGVAFAKRLRIPLFGASRRVATLDAAEHERRGAESLRRAGLSVARDAAADHDQ